MSFLKIIDLTIEPIFKKIMALSFLKKLSNGTLDKTIFHTYLEQDYYYRLDYAESLQLLAKYLQSRSTVFTIMCWILLKRTWF